MRIYIINKLNLTKDGLFVKGTKQKVHLQQGALDGACAVYSMMMCLIINKVIKRNEYAFYCKIQLLELSRRLRCYY